MIERLLEMAGKVSDRAEVYSASGRTDDLSFEDAHLKDIESSMQSGVSLRIIKDGRLGFAHTRNLLRVEELVQNAVDSLKGGVEGSFDLPCTKETSSLHTYDASIESLTNSKMADECERVCELLSRRISVGQINVSARRSVGSIRILNSAGTDLQMKTSAYVLNSQVVYPYSHASLHRALVAKTFERAPGDYLDHLSETFTRSVKEVRPGGGEMKVLFLPETVYTLTWRLQSGTSGVSLYQDISPLLGKKGRKIFDENFSVSDDPLNDALPGARSFDDEGTPCSFFQVIDRGILRNFYCDLYFAQKLGESPTGHGFKSSVSSKPVPMLGHLTISPGNTSFPDLVKSVDRGIIIAGALGAHSGNIPNGDFSIGISPALYVEGGEIVGHVKDCMAAGNIYDTLKKVSGIEDRLYRCSGGNLPALLFDNIHVTMKG